MLDEGIYDVAQFKEGGWVTDLKYEDEINDMLKPKTGAVFCFVLLCHVMLCYAMLCCDVLCCAALCSARRGREG